MRILHVTPHLPPDQAANALLPWQLGTWSRDEGDQVEYVAHPPRAGGGAAQPGPVAWVRRRSGGFIDRGLRLGSIPASLRLFRALQPPVQRADVVHVHSNGLLAELAVLVARRQHKPVVLTLYGTEIWHYAPRRIDLFTRAYRGASYVTFYSERLMDRANELGLRRPGASVVYPPVGGAFRFHDEPQQSDVRARLGVTSRHLLLNVKRLHPLAGQRYLLEAMNAIVGVLPDTRLVICGAGPLLDELRTVARLCAAAARFWLPSLLEALPTVAVEALACGTPVVSSDSPGGLELNGLFGPDVAIVPREQPVALAQAVIDFLQQKRRTLAGTRQTIGRAFSREAVMASYRAIYERVTNAAADGDA